MKGTASRQMLFKFVAPFLHDADRRQRRRVTERTERAAQHVLGEVTNDVDVLRAAVTGMEALQPLSSVLFFSTKPAASSTTL